MPVGAAGGAAGSLGGGGRPEAQVLLDEVDGQFGGANY
jgi:hypothetical protein